MDRILKKFCAREVQILLDRIRERPEDFDEGRMGIWYRLAKHKRDYTWVERKAINYAMRKRDKVHNRRLLLAKILDATVNPKGSNEETFKYVKPGQFIQPNSLAEYQSMRTEMMRQMMNAASPNNVGFDSYGRTLDANNNY